MAFVVTSRCVGSKAKSCVPVCPIPCFYEGEKQMVIHPELCIDCAACADACPVQAIFMDIDVPEKYRPSIQEAVDFFKNGLPGSAEPAQP